MLDELARRRELTADLVDGVADTVARFHDRRLEVCGNEIVRLDLWRAESQYSDVQDLGRVREAMTQRRGVVLVAGAFHVVWAERVLEDCQDTSMGGVRRVLEAAFEQTTRLWIPLAGGGAVYMEPRHLQAAEDTPLLPVTVYGRSKTRETLPPLEWNSVSSSRL